MTLDFKTLRETNVQRCNRWHALDSWSVERWACATAGEAGETCNAVKKFWRVEEGIQSPKNPPNREAAIAAIGREIADTVIYADLTAARLGLALDDLIIEAFNRVSEENGFPERLTP